MVVNRKSTPPIPEAIAQLQHQLDQFRSTQPHWTTLPEPLWQDAVELARQHGIYSVAHPRRLDYMGLKKRVGIVPALRRKANKPTFVELAGELNGANLFDYLTESQKHVEELKQKPSEWMPWNYRGTM